MTLIAPAAPVILGLDIPLQQLMLLAGLSILLATVLVGKARRRARITRVDGKAGEQTLRHNARLETQAREDIQEMMARMEELSREICSQIDARCSLMEQLMAEADRKVAALQSARQHAQTAEASPPAAPADPRQVEIIRLAGQGQAVVEIARRVNMTAGEVELVLSLDRSRRSLAEPPPTIEPAPPTAKPRRLIDERA